MGAPVVGLQDTPIIRVTLGRFEIGSCSDLGIFVWPSSAFELVISVLSIVPEQFSERAHEICGLLAEGRDW